MKRKFKQWRSNDSTNINKTKRTNHLSQLNEHKNDIRHWTFRSWFGTGTYMWRG